jgi:hydroxymethylglutaryl-CoA reductase
MPINQTTWSGFSKLNRTDRFQKLLDLGLLTQDDLNYLQQGGIQTPDLAEKFVENVIGYFQLPLGVAVNVRMDQRDYVVPMAVEETSIIAAMSKTAAWINQHGTLTTHITGECIIGQIQCAIVNDFSNFANKFAQHKNNLIAQANQEVAMSMVKRGGGVIDLELRKITRPDGKDMAIIHLLMNSCDAMGANIINQVLEYLKPHIEQLTNEKVNICILSNLNDQKLTHATLTIQNIDPILGNKLQEASFFAELDPYRAATSNKGVMNGIDPVVIATGNDWRAIEAGVHAYATRNGSYQSITHWRYNEGVLTGKLTAPLIVGTVGGVTALHPTAGLCLKMLNVESANNLSRILAGVGLIQNLGAIKALCTDGITKGHMKLHINNLVLATDANNIEAPILKQQLSKWLEENQRVSMQHAQMLLERIRQNSVNV